MRGRPLNFTRPANAVRAAHPAGDGRTWYRITDHDDGPTEVLIYDEIGWYGVTASDFVAAMAQVSGDVTLRINSPGGDVFDGIAIYNAIRNHSGTVTAHVDGLAASAASFILQAADSRVAQPHSQVMIHDAAGMCIGQASDMRAMTELLDKVSGNIAEVYADRSATSAEAWRAAMLAESWYTPAEALAAGLVDSVAPKDPAHAPAAPEDAWDLSVFAYAGRAEAPAPVRPFVFDAGHLAQFRRAFEEART